MQHQRQSARDLGHPGEVSGELYDVQAILTGLYNLLDLNTLFWLLAGFGMGFVVGAIPGFNDANLLAILLPFTLLLEPTDAIVAMAALYVSAQAAGSIPAILINIPGTPGTSATCLEGYPLARQGRAAFALGISFAASTIGGLLGAIASVVVAPILGTFALRFGPAEMFMIGVFGLSVVSSLTAGDVLKGLLITCFGLLISLIGMDSMQGYPRSTFGILELYDGLPMIPVLLGLFGFSEILFLMKQTMVAQMAEPGNRSWSQIIQGMREAVRYRMTLFRSSVIGTIVGIIPGAGAAIGSFVAYSQAKQWSKTPEKFGKGHPEGLVATDSANNAVACGAMVPLLTLGLPGSSSTTLMLAALFLHGVRPGPRFFLNFQTEAYTILFSLVLASLLILVFGLLLARHFQAVAFVPTRFLVPIVAVLLFLGAYAWRYLAFDIILMVVFGLFGALCKAYNYPVPALLLAIILGPMIESNFLRAIRIGGYATFFQSEVSVVLMVLTALSLLGPPVLRYLRNRSPKTTPFDAPTTT